MLKSKEIKAEAKARLQGHWGLAIGSSMMALLLNSMASSQSILQVFVGGPVAIGTCSVFSGLVRNEEDVTFNRVFRGFARNYFVNVLVGFLLTLFVALWTLLFIVPGIIMHYAYAMTMFIQNDNPDKRGSAAIYASRDMMKGHKGQLFVLDLSFLGWDLLNLLTCGTLSVYVAPYKTAAYAVFYEQLLSEQAALNLCKAAEDAATTDDVANIEANAAGTGAPPIE